MAEEALLEEIRDLVESDAARDAAARLAAVHPADAADVIAGLDGDARSALIRGLERDPLARIIEYLPDEPRAALIDEIEVPELAAVLDEVDDDIVADILHELPPERANEILGSMRRAAAVAPLLRHADETAGGHMTRAFLQLSQNWTADRAIQYLRRVRPDADSAYYLYITDPSQRLEGIVSLRDLIIAAPSTPLSEIMHRDVHKARDDMDQEDMARMVQRYDLVALPVVDAQDRLVGVITVDDVLDVVEQEATEDIFKLAGVGVKETALSPVRESMRRRLPWLIVNMCVALAASFVVSLFEETIGKVAALAAIMPIVAGQGGNAGVQTATIVVRGLALDEIDVSDLLRVLWKEILLGCVKGVLFGGMLGLISYVWLGDQNLTLSLVAAVAMFANMLVASIGGVMIPMTLRYGLKLDPATAAGVFDTMLTDIMGFFIFLGLSTLLLSQIE
jgi:magnesium transporter